MATIICRGCREEINTANNYCPYCDLKVGVIGNCPNCGQELTTPANNCYHCNTPLPEALQDLTPEKSSDPKPVSRTVSANYFLMHWRGELSLGVAYWGNLILLTMFFSFLGNQIDEISLTIHPVVYSRLAFSFNMFIIFILHSIFISAKIIFNFIIKNISKFTPIYMIFLFIFLFRFLF